jgi:AcrR family transcriptional regulator
VRDAERSRSRVLAAAMREFAEHGFNGARIDRIATRAGVNKQLIYYYFGSKADLYVAVLESAYAALRAAESDLHLEALDPEDGIRELALFNWRYHVAHPELISLVRTENLHKARHLRRARRLSELNPPLVAAVSGLLQRGAESGRFRADADPIEVYVTIAALSFYYLGNSATLAVNFGRDLMAADRLERWGEHMVDVILSYLQPPGEGRPGGPLDGGLNEAGALWSSRRREAGPAGPRGTAARPVGADR